LYDCLSLFSFVLRDLSCLFCVVVDSLDPSTTTTHNPAVHQVSLREAIKVKFSWFDLKDKLDENLFDLGNLPQNEKFNLAFTFAADEVLESNQKRFSSSYYFVLNFYYFFLFRVVLSCD
jgi:hypothetical protein